MVQSVSAGGANVPLRPRRHVVDVKNWGQFGVAASDLGEIRRMDRITSPASMQARLELRSNDKVLSKIYGMWSKVSKDENEMMLKSAYVELFIKFYNGLVNNLSPHEMEEEVEADWGCDNNDAALNFSAFGRVLFHWAELCCSSTRVNECLQFMNFCETKFFAEPGEGLKTPSRSLGVLGALRTGPSPRERTWGRLRMTVMSSAPANSRESPSTPAAPAPPTSPAPEGASPTVVQRIRRALTVDTRPATTPQSVPSFARLRSSPHSPALFSSFCRMSSTSSFQNAVTSPSTATPRSAGWQEHDPRPQDSYSSYSPLRRLLEQVVEEDHGLDTCCHEPQDDAEHIFTSRAICYNWVEFQHRPIRFFNKHPKRKMTLKEYLEALMVFKSSKKCFDQQTATASSPFNWITSIVVASAVVAAAAIAAGEPQASRDTPLEEEQAKIWSALCDNFLADPGSETPAALKPEPTPFTKWVNSMRQDRPGPSPLFTLGGTEYHTHQWSMSSDEGSQHNTCAVQCSPVMQSVRLDAEEAVSMHNGRPTSRSNVIYMALVNNLSQYESPTSAAAVYESVVFGSGLWPVRVSAAPHPTPPHAASAPSPRNGPCFFVQGQNVALSWDSGRKSWESAHQSSGRNSWEAVRRDSGHKPSHGVVGSCALGSEQRCTAPRWRRASAVVDPSPRSAPQKSEGIYLSKVGDRLWLDKAVLQRSPFAVPPHVAGSGLNRAMAMHDKARQKSTPRCPSPVSNQVAAKSARGLARSSGVSVGGPGVHSAGLSQPRVYSNILPTACTNNMAKNRL